LRATSKYVWGCDDDNRDSTDGIETLQFLILSVALIFVTYLIVCRKKFVSNWLRAKRFLLNYSYTRYIFKL